MKHTVPAADLLDAAEERELARRIELGVYARSLGGRPHPGASADELDRLMREGEQAWERFLLANVRLVSMVSRPHARVHQVSEADLFQEGFAGMVAALQRFDHNQPCRFATYALPWIRNHVSMAVRDRSSHGVGFSRATERLLAQIRCAWRELAQQLRREPTAAEVAARLQVPTDQVLRALSGPVVSLLGDRAPEAADMHAERRIAEVLDERARSQVTPVRRWLAELPPLQAKLLELRFGFGGTVHSYAEIGRLLGLHISSVRRLETRALAGLREVCHTDAWLLAG